MKKFICFTVIFTLFFTESFAVFADNKPTGLSAASAILIEASSGTVVFEKNASAKLPMASTTKIMTALVVAEECDLDETVVITESGIKTHGSSMYLKAGERLTVKELLYGLMLASGNDAALMLAEYVAGGEQAFSKLMNIKAQKLGLKSTSFENASGLDGENHYTTAHELALMARQALFNEVLADIMSTKTISVHYENKENCRHLKNHNRLLWTYDGAIGVKTGFTKKAGRCLVSAAERNGVKLIAVTLNAPNDWNDHKTLLDYGFSKVSSKTINKKGERAVSLPVISGFAESVDCVFADDIKAITVDGAVCSSITIEAPQFLFAPIAKGRLVGKAVVRGNDGQIITETEILADKSIELKSKKKTIFDKILDIFR